jgi:FMN-dependent NADH-azoreductase
VAFAAGTVQNEAIQKDATRNARILEEFLAADVIVIGAPMYNFSLPSQLKAWLDRLAVAGKTFRYTATGVEGLIKGKRVLIASTRGGFYSGSYPTAFLDHQESYLKAVFGFIGITDISIVRAEGLAVSPESRKASMDAAVAEIGKLSA